MHFHRIFGIFLKIKIKLLSLFNYLIIVLLFNQKYNNVQLNLILDTGSGYNILFAFPEKDSIAFYNTSKLKLLVQE